MSSTRNSLVLGAFSGIPVELIEPFVRSLRASGYAGSFCIVAGRCDPERLAPLADSVVHVASEYGNSLRATRAVLGFLRRTRGFRRFYPSAFRAAIRARPSRWRVLEYHLEGLQSLRYAHYLRYLEEVAVDADVVMITDLRDVFFQRDPFAGPLDGLEVYLEDASVRIGEDDFNTRWLRDIAGPAGLARLRGRPVSCSGTVIGTRAAMLAYLREMTAAISESRGPMGPHDQAVHNVLLAEGRLNATVVPNGSGRVLTLGKAKGFEISADGTVLNDDGSVPAVLHQWDRHAALVQRLTEA